MARTPLPPKPGALNVGWLRMLKNSLRNCRWNRSVKGIFLNMEKSQVIIPGPDTCEAVPPSKARPFKPAMHLEGMLKPGGGQGMVKAAGFRKLSGAPEPCLSTPGMVKS